jgi:CheY-like chemotaxis protein
VVDDDPVMLKTASMKLGHQGFTVITATDGASAIRTVRERKPDLILLDLTFPPDVAHGGGVPWDGYLIMSWLRRMGESKDIPVLVVTGGAAAEHQRRSMAAGACGFFQKPVDYACLLAAIGRCVCPKAGEAPSGEATADYQI